MPLQRQNITITAHDNWCTFYKNLIEDINIDFHINKYKDKDILTIRTGKKENIIKILDFVNSHNLLKLERKWKKIVF